MKKKWLALGLSLALSASLVPQAGAWYWADGYLFENEETAQFWRKHKPALDAKEVYSLFGNYHGFTGEFHEGLLLVHDGATPPEGYLGGYYDNYVDKNGNLLDLNKGRFTCSMYPFSEGRAAGVDIVETEDEGIIHVVGYVDAQGGEVIPSNSEWREFHLGSSDYTGAFRNGRAVVIREPQPGPVYEDTFKESGWRGDGMYTTNIPDLSYLEGHSEDSWSWYGFDYAYIDKNGNMLTGWTFTRDKNVLFNLPLYDQYGFWIGDNVDPNFEGKPQEGERELPSGGAAPGVEEPKPPEEAPFVPEEHYPGLPEYNKNTPSLFASNAKVTGFTLGDLDMGEAIVTITNPTDQVDAGVVGAAFANTEGDNGRAAMYFIPYELGPGESREYRVWMGKIINQGMFVYDRLHPYAEQLDGKVAATLFLFEDDADLRSLYATVPYEQNWYPSNMTSDSVQPICDSAAGDVWLRDTAGISRPSTNLSAVLYYLPNGKETPGDKADHSYCKR